MSFHDATIIDSHIHLYAKTHLPRLNWTGDLLPDHILNRQNSVEEYKDATRSDPRVRGFVFLETDRKFGLDESGWADPLEEVAFLARIAHGNPIKGEGHTGPDGRFVLGIVPWAPIPAGPEVLRKYIRKVEEVCRYQSTFNLVKGFRYLVQDKPDGTMLDPEFIASLQLLGDLGFTFDLGVDARQRGLGQLEEAKQMLEKVFADGSRLRVIINHCCKPDLRAQNSTSEDDEVRNMYRQHITDLAKFPTTYMKLSGLFSEMPPQDEDSPTPIPQLLEEFQRYLGFIFDVFGPSRIMFGSDWPVCSAGGPGSKAWRHWVDLVTTILDSQRLKPKEKKRIWSGTAVEAYNIVL